MRVRVTFHARVCNVPRACVTFDARRHSTFRRTSRRLAAPLANPFSRRDRPVSPRNTHADDRARRWEWRICPGGPPVASAAGGFTVKPPIFTVKPPVFTVKPPAAPRHVANPFSPRDRPISPLNTHADRSRTALGVENLSWWASAAVASGRFHRGRFHGRPPAAPHPGSPIASAAIRAKRRHPTAQQSHRARALGAGVAKVGAATPQPTARPPGHGQPVKSAV
jgi:hypothetical protein